MKIFITILLLASLPSWSQVNGMEGIDDNDLKIGGDIFSDFSEDLETGQVAKDERFYRYGRFFTFQIGLGLTTFDGNRGAAYENQNPTYSFSINYFLDFQQTFGLGLAYSKHQFDVDYPSRNFPETPVGLVDVTMLRVFFNYRYYIETTDLGTAITFSNPYFTSRVEYWYTSNKFRDNAVPDDAGGGFGLGVGIGLEFPVKIKESYVNLEFLVHQVAFHDRDTRQFNPNSSKTDNPGFDDLRGLGYSTVLSYVFNW